MQIKITNQDLYDAKRVEAEFLGGTLTITWSENDTINSLEIWGEIGTTDYEEEFGFILTSED